MCPPCVVYGRQPVDNSEEHGYSRDVLLAKTTALDEVLKRALGVPRHDEKRSPPFVASVLDHGRNSGDSLLGKRTHHADLSVKAVRSLLVLESLKRVKAVVTGALHLEHVCLSAFLDYVAGV